MPITKSAKKALRQSKKRRERNLQRKSAVTNILRQIKKLKAEGKTDEALKLLPGVYKTVDKAVKRGLLKKHAAARKKSRMAKLLKK